MRNFPRVSFRARIAVVFLLAASVVPLGHPASASIAQDQALIQRLTAQLAAQDRLGEALAQQYDAATSALAQLDAQLARLRQQLADLSDGISATSSALVTAAIRAYVFDSADAHWLALFHQNVSSSDARQIYENNVLGNLHQLENSLKRQQNQVTETKNQIANARQLAAIQDAKIHSLIGQNAANEQATRATLTSVSRRLRGEIVSYEITVAVSCARHHDTTCVANAVAAAAAVGGTSAANQVTAAVNAAMTTSGVGGSAAGSTQGLAAVRAAESQIGVPYVWGGETARQGFDCSGLTQWAWRQAGFSIPRTAAEQYFNMRHVPLSQLQPGDLLFYYNLDGDHQVDHVVMYVGSGPWGTSTIIAAAHTGTNISLSPIFTYGLIGAGRP
jgi:cell wall-associated NlpC family hydrolase